MNENQKDIKEIVKIFVITIIISLIVILFYYFNFNKISAINLILLGIIAFFYFYKKNKILINMEGLFNFGWFSTIGLSTLRLHNLQEKWSLLTWVCLIATVICFNLGYSVKICKKRESDEKENKVSFENLDFSVNLLTLFCILAFFIEVCINKYIPLFSKQMNAYMKFSVTGVHYFTVSSALILPVCIYIFLNYKDQIDIKIRIKYIFFSLLSIGIPILIVSRQLLIMTIILSFFLLAILRPKKTIKYGLIIFVFVAIGWSILGLFRNQNDEYLRKTLKLKENDNAKLMRTYMYLTFNYDNLNYNVNNLEKYTYGTHTFFPIFALTGLKFIFPILTTRYIKYVIPVFNTCSFIMTYYEDFGIVGVIIFTFILGIISRRISDKDNSPMNLLYKILIMYCIIFTFFTNFFSSPAIWFYFIYIFIANKFIWNNKKLKLK